MIGSIRAQPVAHIPFVLANNVIYISCKVNGHDNLKLLMDTGADGSVLTSASAAKIGLITNGTSVNRGSTGESAVSSSTNNIIEFGGMRNKVAFTVIDFGEAGFDGIIGTDLMKGYAVAINYDTGIISFYKEAGQVPGYNSYTREKLHFPGNYPAVETSIKAGDKIHKALFGLDTGADDVLTLTLAFTKKHSLKDKLPIVGSAIFQGSEGEAYTMPIAECPELTIAGKSFYNLNVALSSATKGIDATTGMDGFYGNNFLKRFNTIFDFKNGFIYFRLNKNLYSGF
jgi:predicted aspartyl protease